MINYGWLSPSGEFFECNFGEHESFALLVLGKESTHLENIGWLKIGLNYWDGSLCCFTPIGKFLTNYQKIFLNKHEITREYF